MAGEFTGTQAGTTDTEILAESETEYLETSPGLPIN